MTWLTDFVALAGAGGIVSGSVSHGLNRWSERVAARRQARYLALRVSIALERFAGDCVNLVSDIDVAVQLNADRERLPTTLPLVAEFPADDPGWRVIDGTLAHRVLTIAVDRNSRQGSIAEQWAYGGPDTAPFECARQAAIIGWNAWQVAADLRASYDLPAYQPEHRFDRSLQQRVEDDEAARQRNMDDLRLRTGNFD